MTAPQDAALLNYLFGNAREAVVLVSGPEHRVLYANERFRSLVEEVPAIGLPFGEKARTPILDLVSEKGWAVEALPVRLADDDGHAILIRVHESHERARAFEEAHRQARLLEAVFNCAPCGIAIVSAAEQRVTAVSAYGCDIRGLRRADLEGLTLREILDRYPFYRPGEEAPMAPEELPVARVMATGETVLEEELELEDRTLERIPIVCSAAPVPDANGSGIYCGLVTWYVTARQKRLENALRDAVADKEVLLRELSHRVKNNLQAIGMLLTVQATKTANQEVKEALQQAAGRVTALATMHHRLYEQPDFNGRVDLAAALTELGIDLERTYPNIRAEFDLTCPFMVGADTATPLLLLAHELIVNAGKHAFPGRERGTVTVGLHRSDDGGGRLTIADDGIGLCPKAEDGSMGMGLVQGLVRQSMGRLEIDNNPGGGTRVTVHFHP